MGLKEHLTLREKDANHISLIDQLKEDGLPVVMWGCGSLSYNTRRMLESNGVKISACWAEGKHADSAGGIPVLDYDQVAGRYSRFNVVCGHSRYDLAINAQTSHEEINKVYCFVNICYGLWNGISSEFILSHMDEYEEAYELFCDEESKRCFAAYLNCKNNEDYTYLLSCYKNLVSYFDNPFFVTGDSEVYLDAGAYDGDTIREFLKAAGGKYAEIIALEPERENYAKLFKYVQEECLERVELYDNGCWDSDTVLKFAVDKESSGLNAQGTEELKVRRIDSQFCSKEISLIKINYLSGVVETLRGAEKILKEKKPNLAVMAGFDEWGIIKIPQIIKKMNPEYRLALRYASPMPARLMLFGY